MKKQPILVAPNMDGLDLATMITRIKTMRDYLARCPDVPNHKNRPPNELRSFRVPDSSVYFYYQSYQKTDARCDFALTMMKHRSIRPFTLKDAARSDFDPEQRNERLYILAKLETILAQAKELTTRKKNDEEIPGLTPEAKQICEHIGAFLASRARSRELQPTSLSITPGRPYRNFVAVLATILPSRSNITLTNEESEIVGALLPPISKISLRDQDGKLTYQLEPTELNFPVTEYPSVIDEMKAYRALGIGGQAKTAKAHRP